MYNGQLADVGLTSENGQLDGQCYVLLLKTNNTSIHKMHTIS